ncbi:hypothetical protein ACRRTK_015484 [Alexandromys fortis]
MASVLHGEQSFRLCFMGNNHSGCHITSGLQTTANGIHESSRCISQSRSAVGYMEGVTVEYGKGFTAGTEGRESGGMGSKSQNCLWNSLIDGLTGNVKEKPRPTIVQDTRPPEEILADELPQLDSPEALVKTSFRFGG